jgi:hypothetical protein
VNVDGIVARGSRQRNGRSDGGGSCYNEVINGLDDGLLRLRYVRLCDEIGIFVVRSYKFGHGNGELR